MGFLAGVLAGLLAATAMPVYRRGSEHDVALWLLGAVVAVILFGVHRMVERGVSQSRREAFEERLADPLGLHKTTEDERKWLLGQLNVYRTTIAPKLFGKRDGE